MIGIKTKIVVIFGWHEGFLIWMGETWRDFYGGWQDTVSWPGFTWVLSLYLLTKLWGIGFSFQYLHFILQEQERSSGTFNEITEQVENRDGNTLIAMILKIKMWL